MTHTGIDKSRLPHVHDVCQCFSVLEDGALAHSLQEQEIEQFYSANMQKNQAVQSDVRLARRLQDQEDDRVQLTPNQLQQLEQRDCDYARAIQEELRQCDEDAQRREREDEEMAKRLQEEEESKMRQERKEAGYHEDTGDSPLSQGLGLWEQMMRDAELARRLQEEEDTQPHRTSPESAVDFRTVQVAQDEELARFMQRQEKKSNRRSRGPLSPEGSHDPRGTGRRVQRERLNSEGLYSPVEEEDQHSLIPTSTTLNTHAFHNIAEELDPTFTGRKQERETRISTAAASGICLAPRTPHSVFYDYLPEPSAIPASRRHTDKPPRYKSKEKRESCKQQ